MNEFTKEELQSIREVLEGAWGKDQLIDKIQSMIDHHCEHDYIPPKGSKFTHVCGNCGEDVNNE